MSSRCSKPIDLCHLTALRFLSGIPGGSVHHHAHNHLAPHTKPTEVTLVNFERVGTRSVKRQLTIPTWLWHFYAKLKKVQEKELQDKLKEVQENNVKKFTWGIKCNPGNYTLVYANGAPQFLVPTTALQ